MNTPNTETKQKPKWHLQAGVLQVACWNSGVKADEGSERAFLTVTLQRSFKGKDGQWLRSQALRRQDLLPMARLLEQAYDKLNSGS